MKTWNKTSATDLVIATGSSNDRVSAQFYNAADLDAVDVIIKVDDAAGGGGEKIIKKFTLEPEASNHYTVNQLETSDTVTVTTGAGVDLNIVTWN